MRRHTARQTVAKRAAEVRRDKEERAGAERSPVEESEEERSEELCKAVSIRNRSCQSVGAVSVAAEI